MSATTSPWRNCAPAPRRKPRARRARCGPSSTAAISRRRPSWCWCRPPPPTGRAPATRRWRWRRRCWPRAGLPPETATRAWYIRGAVSADRGDAPGLAQALAAIPPSAQPDQEADRHELAGRAAVLAGADDRAASAFEQAADQRRLALDYRGMARALSFAGDAVLRQGRVEDAANLFLRAGRSALLQGDAVTGRRLLDRADSLAKQSGADRRQRRSRPRPQGCSRRRADTLDGLLAHASSLTRADPQVALMIMMRSTWRFLRSDEPSWTFAPERKDCGSRSRARVSRWAMA